MTRYHTRATIDSGGNQTGQENVPFTVEEESAADAAEAAITEAEKEYIAKEKYKSDRRRLYPSWEEQLDMQYHDLVNGTTTWKDAVAKVKSDNPKS